MVDFSYKKDGDFITLTIRTDSTEIGTLFRIVACLYALKMDIIEGEVQTIQLSELQTMDKFLVQSTDNTIDPTFQLGVLMDSIFTKYEDIDKVLENYNLGDPDPSHFFDGNFEFIFTEDPNTKTTCFYMESKNGRGLLYHITRVLMKNRIDIWSAKIETDFERNIAMDRFYIRQENGEVLTEEMIEHLKKEILKPCQ